MGDKENQGFVLYARECKTCQHVIKTRKEFDDWSGGKFTKVVSMMCGLGNFKIPRKSGGTSCNRWSVL